MASADICKPHARCWTKQRRCLVLRELHPIQVCFSRHNLTKAAAAAGSDGMDAWQVHLAGLCANKVRI